MESRLRLLKTGLLFFVLVFSNSIYSQPGTLDASFGNGGKVTTEVYSGVDTGSQEQIQKLLIQKNQKIVAAGSFAIRGPYGVVLTRYNTNGSLDKSFGKKGETIISKPAIFFSCSDAVLQPNDKILVAGTIMNPYYHYPPHNYPLLMRFTKDGTIDSSFGINGFIDTTGRRESHFNLVTTLGDNSIIVTGDQDFYHWDSLHSFYQWDSTYAFIEKYSQKGIKDTSFGVHGQVILKSLPSVVLIKFIGIQNNNKILLSTESLGSIDSSYMIRLTSSGKYDSTFGNSGKVLTGLFSHYSLQDTLNSVPILTGIRNDGKIVLVIAMWQSVKTYLQYYNSKGVIDSSFGINGKILINDTLSKDIMLIQNDNKIVFGSYFPDTSRIKYSVANFGISRINPNGALDSSFGTNGITITDFNTFSKPACIVMQQDKKILMGGYTSRNIVNGSIENFALARYNNDTTVNHLTKTSSLQNYQVEKNNVRVYPNPAQNVLHVEGLSANAKLMAVDLRGRIVLSRELSVVSGVYDLNIASLHAGNYLLKIEANGEVVTKQFVKE